MRHSARPLCLYGIRYSISVYKFALKKKQARGKKAVNQNDFTNAVLGHFLQQNANQTKALSKLAFESKIVTTIEKQSL